MKTLNTRNLAAKIIFFVLGIVLCFAAFYQDTLSAFWLTEKESSGINWPMALAGFFLVFGSRWFNTIADAIAEMIKFLIKKNQNDRKI